MTVHLNGHEVYFHDVWSLSDIVDKDDMMMSDAVMSCDLNDSYCFGDSDNVVYLCPSLLILLCVDLHCSEMKVLG